MKPKRRTSLLLEDALGPNDASWRDHEDRVARKTGGKTQPGSGSGPIHLEDTVFPSKIGTFLLQDKSTKGASIRVQGHVLSALSMHAQQAACHPGLAFTIAGHDDPLLEKDWVAIPLPLLMRLLNE